MLDLEMLRSMLRLMQIQVIENFLACAFMTSCIGFMFCQIRINVGLRKRLNQLEKER